MKYLLPFIIGLAMMSCDQSQKPAKVSEGNNTPQDSLTAELEQLYQNGVINGFGVAIVNQNKVLYKNGFGFADAANKQPYTMNTIQNIASVSKTLIGIALLKAQELGKLNLDDPVNKHLSFNVVNPNFPDQDITIRQLATHTSSITDGAIYDKTSYILKSPVDSLDAEKMEIPKEFNPPSNKTSMKAYLKDVLDKEGKWYVDSIYLKEAPGQTFEYTNVGATLAAHIIEAATGEAYNDFTKKHILTPLGMNTSGWSFDEVDFAQHTKLYAKRDTQLAFYSLITYPDGGLITSVNDLSKYLVELIRGYTEEGTLLSKASYKELFKLQLAESNFKDRDSENPYDDEYNSGIFMGFSAHDYVGHTGGDPGVATFMFFNAKNKLGRILFINTNLINDQGVQQYFSIWDKLEKYQSRLSS